ncbi:hypothetical protein F2Q69_00058303 [Brassica cretica]|uniref:Uncharacterized protein n=1 Tax=Brassica cretica TaxID=69181 RepID=A0A8S9RGW0_BRACR|nr:hypothetical protein F2Q69_00058303 [Brassica cretica]
MIPIFHSFKGRFFRSGFEYTGFSDLENFWDDLPVSRLKYNALDDFQEVFQTTSRKSSRRLPGSLPDDFQEVFQTTSRKSCGLLGSLLTKSPFHNRSERFGFSDLDLICRFFRSGRLLRRLTLESMLVFVEE